MVCSPSTRSFSRARTSERGFVLFAALVIAVLYLALIELLWMEGTRALNEAQRFRARVVAAAMAESAVELAAENMLVKLGTTVTASDGQGSMEGTLVRNGEAFELTGTATTSGVVKEEATAYVQGRIVGTRVAIDYSTHSQ